MTTLQVSMESRDTRSTRLNLALEFDIFKPERILHQPIDPKSYSTARSGIVNSNRLARPSKQASIMLKGMEITEFSGSLSS